MQDTLHRDDPAVASHMHSALVPEGLRPKDLKILIVSTPKTGNTWLKSLLALAYDLPVVEFPMPEFWRDFDPEQFDKLGPRWIAHQHLPDEIRPVPEPMLKNAVAKSRIEQMRINVGEDRHFFRGGGVGGWRSSLPRSIIELLGQLPPYPAQFRWLGYDLDARIADC